MKRFAALITALAMVLTMIFAVPVSAAETAAPAVTGWEVSTGHGGEVRGSGYSTTDEQYITLTVKFG